MVKENKAVPPSHSMTLFFRADEQLRIVYAGNVPCRLCLYSGKNIRDSICMEKDGSGGDRSLFQCAFWLFVLLHL